MKANEAPERIWIDPATDLPKLSGHIDKGSVGYIRTDAFIEKACSWLKESVTNAPECNRIISKKGVITMGLLIEDFKNYMKGE